MSQTVLEAKPRERAVDYATPSTAMARRSTGRLATVIVLLVSFVATATLQHVTQQKHHDLVKNTGSEAKISNLNSFSLALLLGGLRGPLVMMLWTSSETQKQEKDLEDFDSKIELIRLLQPEFDSVHIFQMWNKAYNVSVQMANKSNKYATILDALEYGYKIDRQHPDDINIVAQIGQIFFDKLGNSQEKEYYIDRVERETFADERITLPANRVGELDAILAQAGVDPAKREAMVGQAKRNNWFNVPKLTADAIKPLLNGPGVTYAESMPLVFTDTGRRVRLDPMLELDGTIRKSLLTGQAPRPAGLSADAEWNDGSELQYLKQFEPFTYGISPLGLGWNYCKRAQVLKDSLSQKHLQLSDLVIDNRPAINMMLWGEGEWSSGRASEMRAFGKRIPTADNTDAMRSAIELPTVDVALTTTPSDVLEAKKAIYHYDMVVKVSEHALVEFARHQKRYAGAAVSFQSHRDSLEAMKALCAGDRDYLKAMLLPAAGAAERKALLAGAAESYGLAARLWELTALKYSVDDQVGAHFYPKGITSDNVNTLSTAQVHSLISAIDGLFGAQPQLNAHSDDWVKYQRYYSRALVRVGMIRGQ